MRTTLAIMFTAIALSAPAVNHAHASQWWWIIDHECTSATMSPAEYVEATRKNGATATISDKGTHVWVNIKQGGIVWYRSEDACAMGIRAFDQIAAEKKAELDPYR